MKKIFPVIFLMVFVTGITRGQFLKFNSALIRETLNSENFSKHYTLLVKGNIEKLKNMQKNFGVHINYTYGNIASVTGSLANFCFLSNSSMIERIELSENKKLEPLNDTMRVKNNIVPIQNGMFPLTQAYDGSGVVMGIIDSGIDFTHPDFKDSSGKSRIMYIWDQTFPNAANTPQPYNYGQEWDSSSFNNGTCPHTDVAEWGHGTHVSGIAGGNGGYTGKEIGVAPKVIFVVVALDFNASGPTIADAENYIYTKAGQLGLPCVINASVGDYYGSHDGKDLQTQMMEAMLAPGRLFVAAAGNGGSIPYHLGYNGTADTNFVWAYYSSDHTFQMDFYSDVNSFSNVNYSLGVNNPNSLANIGNIGYQNFNSRLAAPLTDTLYSDTNIVGIVTCVADTTGGVYTVSFTVKTDSLGYLWRFESTGAGRIDSWNFNYLATGLPDSSQFPKIVYYKSPDTLQTIVSGFQCNDNFITVANYTNMDHWLDCRDSISHFTPIYPANQISASSSHGPTRDGRMKPDITASGDNMFSAAVLSLIPGFLSSIPYEISPDSLHIIDGGTSSASPVVAGLGALFLQRDPNITNAIFKQAIQSCAKQDTFTGTALPNVVWGYGKVDGFAAMNCITLGVTGETKNNFPEVTVFPNPFKSELNFSFAKKVNAKDGVIYLHDAVGRRVAEQRNYISEGIVKISLQQLPEGIYFYSVYSSEGILLKNGKVIRE